MGEWANLGDPGTDLLSTEFSTTLTKAYLILVHRYGKTPPEWDMPSPLPLSASTHT